MNILTEFFKKLNIRNFFACGSMMVVLSFVYSCQVTVRIMGLILMAPFLFEKIITIISKIDNWLKIKKIIKNINKTSNIKPFLQHICRKDVISEKSIHQYNVNKEDDRKIYIDDINRMIIASILQKTDGFVSDYHIKDKETAKYMTDDKKSSVYKVNTDKVNSIIKYFYDKK